jgi:hypothetical protein
MEKEHKNQDCFGLLGKGAGQSSTTTVVMLPSKSSPPIFGVQEEGEIAQGGMSL